jgi:hypothetical protein
MMERLCRGSGDEEYLQIHHIGAGRAGDDEIVKGLEKVIGVIAVEEGAGLEIHGARAR